MGFNLGREFRKFGQKFVKGANTAINFTQNKLLPSVEKVAGQVAGGIGKYGIPIVAGVAPELLPVAFGAQKLAQAVSSGAHQGRAMIGTGRKVVADLKSGDTAGAIAHGQQLRRQGEGLYQTGAQAVNQMEGSGMRIPTTRNPLNGRLAQ